MKKITSISDAQEAMIPALVEHWVKSAEEPTSYEDMKSAVDRMYQLMGQKAPLLLIAQSPWAAVVTAAALKIIAGDKERISTLRSTLCSTLGSTLRSTLDSTLGSTLGSTLDSTLYSTLDSTLGETSEVKIKDALNFGYGGGYLVQWWAFLAGYYELGKEIGVQFDEEKYRLFTDFTKAFPYIIALENIAIVSMKPTKIRWIDSPVSEVSGIKPENMPKNRILHADGEKAVEFADGWGVYCNNNVRLPENYGLTKITEWKSEWLLSEQNAELRMVLIKGIGYDRICEELKAKKLHEWREYELLRIDNADVEPIHLLKMTCPSTGKIHVGRTPPDIEDAREAAKWRNHGIDPESFIVEQ